VGQSVILLKKHAANFSNQVTIFQKLTVRPIPNYSQKHYFVASTPGFS